MSKGVFDVWCQIAIHSCVVIPFFCNYISRLLSFISYFDKMSLKSGLNTKCLHSREQDHLIWKHDFWEETFFTVMKMSNFVFRTSSDNSLRLTKYGVNALASWETIPPSFLQFGSIWVIHTHTYLCAFLVGHITLFWTILPLTMTKYPKDVKRGSQFIALCKANKSKAKQCATLIFIVV